MAKFKPAGSRKAGSKDKRSNLGFIPCLILVLLGLGLVFALFYALLTAGK
ncbi:MAG TPA: hypothetical protein VN841_23755 [Bryobacteraceae bacterium]|nr:hypothetical protein [Bryobacteraceae bacterium]